MAKIRVVVVDDSALIRSLLKEVIDTAGDMVCVATAPDPLIAREYIRELNPDVITLDVEMPKMDGLDFLARLMRLKPTPVLMISSLTEQGSEVALRALELGAVDFIAKPKMNIASKIDEYTDEIREKIRMASKAKVRSLIHDPISPSHTADAVLAKSSRPLLKSEKIIIVGSSTGGTEALKEFLMPMPPDAPAIMIAQHMPESFTKSFANRLNSLCRISVKEAEHGERVLPGHAYIAPGHSHLILGVSGANYVCELSQASPVNRHRPSVDVLFRSAANVAGRNAVGVILTGMGKDGAQGMLEMHQAGSHNFAQDEASCVVFGMPKEAIAVGGVHDIVPLKDMSQRVLAWIAANSSRALRI
ncbi:chemotaxis response regulator protein-glutamate methylesterase [Chitinibacter bivalviorum]|uniref:Protein-glutamate methylesterase/protein-glutamine glutaminase n=1 Tax=Chitinibacter bivalviorum TaxID=2739434 RepID=A0A7H9BHH3_9NEIS|nr:chemotaxis response regulator protein-glutamate methylesterase [Chitinibacter bivalviorum]QLG88087.1 chemotaxis response regulator protein-glutamate methylesterase [Chitinibacter bivalviorum]